LRSIQPLKDVAECDLAQLRILLEALDEEALEAVRGDTPELHTRLDLGRLDERSAVGRVADHRCVADELVTGGDLRQGEIAGSECRLLCAGVNKGDFADEGVV
jgi:hypothetical protein